MDFMVMSCYIRYQKDASTLYQMTGPNRKHFVDDNLDRAKILISVYDMVENAAWLPAFSPFPTMFSKAFFLRVINPLPDEKL